MRHFSDLVVFRGKIKTTNKTKQQQNYFCFWILFTVFVRSTDISRKISNAKIERIISRKCPIVTKDAYERVINSVRKQVSKENPVMQGPLFFEDVVPKMVRVKIRNTKIPNFAWIATFDQSIFGYMGSKREYLYLFLHRWKMKICTGKCSELNGKCSNFWKIILWIDRQ